MTNNQINYLNLLETQRANRAKEDVSRQNLSETARHNVRTEDESERSNRARESYSILSLAETMRSNKAKETETARSNLAKEGEVNRSNLAKEAEAKRSNLAKESETHRHNTWTEALDYSHQSGLPVVYTPTMVERDAKLKDTLYLPDADRASGWIQSKVPTFGKVYDNVAEFFNGFEGSHKSKFKSPGKLKKRRQTKSK